MFPPLFFFLTKRAPDFATYLTPHNTPDLVFLMKCLMPKGGSGFRNWAPNSKKLSLRISTDLTGWSRLPHTHSGAEPLPTEVLSLALPPAQTSHWPAPLPMLDSHPHCGQSAVGPAGGMQNGKQQKPLLQDLTSDMPKQAHAWVSFPCWLTDLVPGVHLRKDFNCAAPSLVK